MKETTKEVIARYWSIVAPTYDKKIGHGLRTPNEKIAWQTSLRTFLPPAPATILDVGMGTGFLMHLLDAIGYTVNGLDISPEMVRVAKSNWASSDKARMFVADAEILPFPNNQFDAVVNRFLIWTLPDPERAISEWVRVSKPGAVILVIDGLWWQNNLSFRFRWALGQILEWWHDRNLPKDLVPIFEDYYSPEVQQSIPLLKHPGPESIAALFRNCGLEDVSIHWLPSISQVEQVILPLRRRLMYQNRFIVIGLRKT